MRRYSTQSGLTAYLWRALLLARSSRLATNRTLTSLSRTHRGPRLCQPQNAVRPEALRARHPRSKESPQATQNLFVGGPALSRWSARWLGLISGALARFKSRRLDPPDPEKHF